MFPANMLRQFQKLVAEHRHRVYTFAHYYLRQRTEAEDVTQEVLLRLWQNLQQLQDDHVLPWLLRVTRNACHDVFRKRRAYRGLVSSEGDPALEAAAEDLRPGPQAVAEQNDLKGQVGEALKRIADPYRTILILREIQEMPYEQISEVLQMPLNTMKVYLHRGRKMLREQFHEVSQR